MSREVIVSDTARVEGSAYHTPGLNWQELRGFPGTAKVKVLRYDVRSGAKTMLVQVPAGGQIFPHTHNTVVQHYVLEGEYETAGHTFKAGSYRLMPKDSPLPAMATKHGVTFLLMSDPEM